MDQGSKGDVSTNEKNKSVHMSNPTLITIISQMSVFRFIIISLSGHA